MCTVTCTCTWMAWCYHAQKQMQNTCNGHKHITTIYGSALYPSLHLILLYAQKYSLCRAERARSRVLLTQSVSSRASLPPLCAGWSRTIWVSLRSPVLWVKWSQFPLGGTQKGGSQDNFKTLHLLLLYAACLCLIFLASPAKSLGRTSLLGNGKNKEGENRSWGRRSILSGSHGVEQTVRGNNKDLYDSKLLLYASLYCQGDRWFHFEASLCPCVCVGKWRGVLERYGPRCVLGKSSCDR